MYIKKCYQIPSQENKEYKGYGKTAIVRESLRIDQIKIEQTAPKLPVLRETIKSFFDRDDVSRATAGKRETVI